MVDVFVEVGVQLGLEDVFEDAELGDFFGFEGLGVVEDLAIAVAEDVGRVPALETQITRFETGRQNGLH